MIKLKRRHVAVQNELKKCRVGTFRYCSSISEHYIASLPFTKRGDKYNYVSCHNWHVKKNMFLGNTAISEYYIASLPFTKRGEFSFG